MNNNTDRYLDVNDKVLVRQFKGEKWIEGKIRKRIGNVLYLVELPSGIVRKRHADQILERNRDLEENEEKKITPEDEGGKAVEIEKYKETGNGKLEAEIKTSGEQNAVERENTAEEKTVPRHSTRSKKPAIKLNL